MINKVRRHHPLQTVNVCTKSHGVYPKTVEITQSGPKWQTDQHCHPSSHAISVAKNDDKLDMQAV